MWGAVCNSSLYTDKSLKGFWWFSSCFSAKVSMNLIESSVWRESLAWEHPLSFLQLLEVFYFIISALKVILVSWYFEPSQPQRVTSWLISDGRLGMSDVFPLSGIWRLSLLFLPVLFFLFCVAGSFALSSFSAVGPFSCWLSRIL